MDAKKDELIANAKEARKKIFDAQIEVHKAWIAADELNKKLVAAGLAELAVRCW